MSGRSAPLAGLRVVEVSAFVAAPLGGMTLAQLGADVIRIDPPGGGLDHRRWPVTPEGTSLFWTGLNKSKSSVVIDIAVPEGRELAMALITAPGREGGILLTNFPPRGWLDHDALAKRRADLIQLTIQGSRDGRSMVDYTVNPTLGLPFLTGRATDPAPVNHVLPAWDLVTGQMAAVGLLAAERHRTRTGVGQHVKLALEDVGLAAMGHLGFLAEAQLGAERPRCGNDLYGAFGRDFPCADGERVMVIGLTEKQWLALVDATGTGPAVEALEREIGVDLKLEGERYRHRDAIAALIRPWIAARALPEIARAFDTRGVCWSRYRTVRQLASSDSIDPASNPLFQLIDQPGVGCVSAPGVPLEFSAFERPPVLSAPTLGQHTEQVLNTVLGIGQAEFGKLLQRGVVACG